MVEFCLFSTFSADRSVYAQHKYGFCRAGATDIAETPKCPATACFNQSCTKCVCGWSENPAAEVGCVKVNTGALSAAVSVGAAIVALALSF